MLDEWDEVLVDSLRRELGAGNEVRYPRMPDEGDPSCARWSAAIRAELAGLDDGAVVAGHSAGGTILAHVLAERPPERDLGAIPSIGTVGEPYDNVARRGGQPALRVRPHSRARTGAVKAIEDLELATLSRVHWWNTARPHDFLNDVPPEEFDATYAAQHADQLLIGIQ